MILDDLCMGMIQETIAGIRRETTVIAHRCQMREAIALNDWEPMSALLDKLSMWLNGYKEFRVMCDIAMEKKEEDGHAPS